MSRDDPKTTHCSYAQDTIYDSSFERADYRSLPPEIVILILESARIVFLYAVSGSSNSIELVTSSAPLPFSKSRLSQLGEHLAIDPKLVLLNHSMMRTLNDKDLGGSLSALLRMFSTSTPSSLEVSYEEISKELHASCLLKL